MGSAGAVCDHAALAIPALPGYRLALCGGLQKWRHPHAAGSGKGRALDDARDPALLGDPDSGQHGAGDPRDDRMGVCRRRSATFDDLFLVRPAIAAAASGADGGAIETSSTAVIESFGCLFAGAVRADDGECKMAAVSASDACNLLTLSNSSPTQCSLEWR